MTEIAVLDEFAAPSSVGYVCGMVVGCAPDMAGGVRLTLAVTERNRVLQYTVSCATGSDGQVMLGGNPHVLMGQMVAAGGRIFATRDAIWMNADTVEIRQGVLDLMAPPAEEDEPEEGDGSPETEGEGAAAVARAEALLNRDRLEQTEG